MSENPEMWTAINTIVVAILTAFAAWGKYQDTIKRKVDELQRAADEESRKKQVAAIEEVKEIVNGPLSHQITTNKELAAINASMAARIAELTGSPQAAREAEASEKKAEAAAAVDKDRQQGHVVKPSTEP